MRSGKIEKKEVPKFSNAEIFNTPKIAINIIGIGAAVIPTAKLAKYALNPEGGANKARAFEPALGYNLSNVEKLVNNIGKRFQIVMELVGENGKKKAKVLLARLLDKNTGEFRLTTIYVDK